MASRRKRPARSKARQNKGKETAPSSSDTIPASEAVIEAKAEDASSKKAGGGAKSPFSSHRREGAQARTSPGGSESSAPDRNRPARATGSWIAVAIAAAAALAATYGLIEARRMSQENAALAGQLQSLGEQLSQIETVDPSPSIDALAARIEGIEEALAELEPRIEKKLEDALGEAAELANRPAPEAAGPDPELLVRLDQLEESLEDALDELDQLDDADAGPPQTDTTPDDQAEGKGGGEVESGESDSWWGFLGRMLKISRIDGE